MQAYSKYEAELAKEAKERQAENMRANQKQNTQKSSNLNETEGHIRVAAEVAKKMGMSENTYRDAKYVVENGTAEQRIGELLLAIPKAQGKRTDIETSSTRTEEVRTKAETVKEMGISQKKKNIWNSANQTLWRIRQRGIGNTNPVKFGRCIKELERIYGVRDGSAGGTGANQHTNKLEPNNSGEAVTQEDLASQYRICF